ncbi:uncharacterized protein L969DRAFT_90665 [Mixia osmundae IAM 14324]|uniref:Protein BTN n=1 Tax=Mixia osmundae (strain CBS 9802 / IAM 14324 / JCM 22182 / KY 12970) TaxID=764103 RepID=G7E1M8_MIXOS|nr:uncharacterized protein L969DRAFT_90665 [Mixia osmundae IAM 14324]KEI36688.1 hypothetical protein L969DRAFT_90665 [Mixia osmundae IAM 14324]GAA96738.1 hypothetical protein E5Q_03409 [Mixia osmundae IAM 14324]
MHPIILAQHEEVEMTTLSDGRVPGSPKLDAAESSSAVATLRDLLKLNTAFFLLGLENNALYVVILSAAQDLLPTDVPTGLILFANIAPALLIKVGWPYLVPGRVRYSRRVASCSLISFIGIIVVALFDSLDMRLLGIALASLSSGLGEMTYLQLSTAYGRDELGSQAVGWFASGTGAAGLVGALLWWLLRGLGIKLGLSITSLIPLGMALTFFVLLPQPHLFASHTSSQTTAYTSIPTADEDLQTLQAESMPVYSTLAGKRVVLSLSQKLALARPLVLPYMIPLFVVYLAEYTINQGVAPTLLYPVPTAQQSWIWSHIIHHLSDYYPLWQLVYQTFVFFSRSSISIFRIPPLPKRLIPLPSLAQVALLGIALLESTRGILTSTFGRHARTSVVAVVALEGLSGGLAYVNVFHRLGLEEAENSSGVAVSPESRIAQREFSIACVGFADTSGILAASLLSAWLQPRLCAYQVEHGRTLCREL